MKMKCVALQGLLALAAVLAPSRAALAAETDAQRTPPQAYFVGEFRGDIPLGNGKGEAVLHCNGALTCRVAFMQPGAAPAVQADRQISNLRAAPWEPRIPNANLDHTRRFMSDPAPRRALDGEDDFLLRSMRELLDGQDRFVACLNTEDERGSSPFAVCTATSDPQARKTVYLLVVTMNATCTGKPFCAYFIVPLNRRDEGVGEARNQAR